MKRKREDRGKDAASGGFNGRAGVGYDCCGDIRAYVYVVICLLNGCVEMKLMRGWKSPGFAAAGVAVGDVGVGEEGGECCG